MTNEERQALIKSVDEALNDIRPHLEVDGGNIEVIDVTDEMIVHVKWLGNCSSCNMSQMTMKAGVEHTLKNRVPGIEGVLAINGVGV